MKTLMQRLEDLLTINSNDTSQTVTFKMNMYNWLMNLCDTLEEDINKKDID